MKPLNTYKPTSTEPVAVTLNLSAWQYAQVADVATKVDWSEVEVGGEAEQVSLYISLLIDQLADWQHGRLTNEELDEFLGSM